MEKGKLALLVSLMTLLCVVGCASIKGAACDTFNVLCDADCEDCDE